MPFPCKNNKALNGKGKLMIVERIENEKYRLELQYTVREAAKSSQKCFI